MAKVANDAVARPTNAQPRGVGVGREEGLLPRLGGDESSTSLLSPVSSVVSVEQSLSPVWSINCFLIILLCGLLTKVLSYYPPVSSKPSSQRET